MDEWMDELTSPTSLVRFFSRPQGAIPIVVTLPFVLRLSLKSKTIGQICAESEKGKEWGRVREYVRWRETNKRSRNIEENSKGFSEREKKRERQHIFTVNEADRRFSTKLTIFHGFYANYKICSPSPLYLPLYFHSYWVQITLLS